MYVYITNYSGYIISNKVSFIVIINIIIKCYIYLHILISIVMTHDYICKFKIPVSCIQNYIII